MKRQRLTITLDSELLPAIDSLVDKDQLRNRSQTIEHLVKEGLGLHQLHQAFLFFPEDWSAERLEQLLSRFQEAEISQLYLCLSKPSQLAEIQTRLGSRFQSVSVPADFGSAGAIMLKKEELEHPFVLAWLNGEGSLPSLLPIYLFHRQHHATLTQVIHPTPTSYQSNQLMLAEPELTQYIPAGIADLQSNVFPELAKLAKIRAYVTT